MKPAADVDIRLSAQRALLGHVTPNLRAFSVELDGFVIRSLAIFEKQPTDDERDNVSVVAAEIQADHFDETAEDLVEISADPRPRSLRHLVYRRYEEGR